MGAHTLDLSRLQRPVWDTERRYGETRNTDSPRFSLLLNRTVFTPRKDPLRPLPVLAVDGRQKASGASTRKRQSDQVGVVPVVAAPPTSNVRPPGLNHHQWGSGTGAASTRSPLITPHFRCNAHWY